MFMLESTVYLEPIRRVDTGAIWGRLLDGSPALIRAEEIYCSGLWLERTLQHRWPIPCFRLEENDGFHILSAKAYALALKKHLQENPDIVRLDGRVVGFCPNDPRVAIIDLGAGLTGTISTFHYARAKVPELKILLEEGQMISNLYISYAQDLWLTREKPPHTEEAQRIGLAEGQMFLCKLGEKTEDGKRYAFLTDDLVGMIQQDTTGDAPVGATGYVMVMKIAELSEERARVSLQRK